MAPKIQNVKLFLEHDNRPNILKNTERKTINDYLNNDNHCTTPPWLGTDTFSSW